MERNCENCLHAEKSSYEYPCNACVRNYMDKWEERRKLTNAEIIKGMTSEQMAKFLSSLTSNLLCCGIVENNILEWLQKESEE